MKYFLFSVSLLFLVVSCKNGTDGANGSQADSTKILTLQNKVKQLQLDNQQKDSVINQSISFFNEIQMNLEKISIKGQKIRVKSSNPELTKEDQQWILKQIASINFLRKQNAQSIRSLKKEINSQSLKISELVKMRDQLVMKIKEKDQQIDSLKDMLSQKDMEYSKLFDQYQEQVELAYNVMQDLNTVYFAYGTKEELLKNGVIQQKGGFLGMGKKTALANDLNQKYFRKLDKTKIKEFTVPGKDPQMITDHPLSSYKWEGDKLIILDADQFWKVSNYLIIEVK